MLQHMKGMARPYATLFVLALVVAVVARIGLAVMDVTGTLAYDYISAADVPMLDVICSILTGSTFVAFMFLAGLVLVISTAGVALYGFLYERGYAGAGKPAMAFLWGWATALAAASQVICAGVAQARARGGAGLGRSLVVAAAVCGLAVMVLTVGTFASINTPSIQMGVVLAWFAADVVVNLGILFGARALEKRAEAAV